MGFQACSNDEVDNVKTTTSNDVEAISASSSLITSEEAKNNIPAFTEAIEAENTLLELFFSQHKQRKSKVSLIFSHITIKF